MNNRQYSEEKKIDWKRNWTEEPSQHENVENVQMFWSAGFICLFHDQVLLGFFTLNLHSSGLSHVALLITNE